MGNIAGPYTTEDWLWMKELRGSINYMQQNNDNQKFNVALSKERVLYKEYTGREAA